MSGGKGHLPRACLRCHEVKPPEAFDMGPAGTRRRGVCQACLASERAEREARAAKRRKTWADPETGRMVRICRTCGETKDLETGFNRGSTSDGRRRRRFICKRCDSARAVEANRRRANDPAQRQKVLAQRVAWALQWRANNRERYLAQVRARRERLMADPEMRARINADARMRHRLRAEREGRTVTRHLKRSRSGVVQNVHTERSNGKVPALPLALRIERLVTTDRLRLVGNEDRAAEAVCARLGIDPRQLWAWRSGEIEDVQLDTADRVLTRTGWHWWDVYGDEPPEVQAKVAHLLAGEEVAG